MSDRNLDMEIVLKGRAACGKTVMAAHLAEFFQFKGITVKYKIRRPFDKDHPRAVANPYPAHTELLKRTVTIIEEEG